ncbi:uncharacterized protein [Temnothorax nylanderi]|uniref:uncharacterized protein n=1 Tax=Temnothorax nylanderi TaxID=102681 RepID=UPI003A8ABCFA
MSSNTMETLHAAVRFYSDERRKVLIVPISDIKDFDHENCTNQPYYIKRHNNDDEHNSFLSPGEVLCVGSKEDLLNKERRFKFSKKRRSDALQQLQMKQIERDGTPKRKTKITKKTLQKLGKMKNGQNELKKFLKNRKYLCTKNNNNKDTDLSNLSSSEPNTSYSTHSTSDTDSEVDMSPITKEKLRQSRKIYSSPGSKQEDPDKNEVACTRQSSQLTGTPEELQPPEDRNETRGNQNRSLRASPNRPKSGCTRQSSQLAGTPEDLQPPEDRNETRGNQNQSSLRASPNRPKSGCTRQSSQLAGTPEDLQPPEDRNETRGNQNQSSLRASPNRPKRTENVNGNTPKRTTSIRRKTLYRLKNRDEPSDSDEEYMRMCITIDFNPKQENQ